MLKTQSELSDSIRVALGDFKISIAIFGLQISSNVAFTRSLEVAGAAVISAGSTNKRIRVLFPLRQDCGPSLGTAIAVAPPRSSCAAVEAAVGTNQALLVLQDKALPTFQATACSSAGDAAQAAAHAAPARGHTKVLIAFLADVSLTLAN